MAAKPLLLGAVLFFIILVFSCKKTAVVVESTDGISKYAYFEDTAMWEHIFDSTDEFYIPEDIAPKAVVIPHHDITTGNQNSFYKALGDVTNPSVVVIVAPDHFEKGQKIITMPEETVFMAPEGNLETSDDLIRKIAENDLVKDVVSLQSDLWFTEHGIFTHAPFIKHYFPDAKIIPILSKMLTTDEEFESFTKLGKVLAEVLPEDALVIASVDFSHYQTPKMTNIHDSVSRNTIQNMEDPRYAEIDSPESIQTIFSYSRQKNAVNPVLIHQSSTYDYIPDEKVESTSHEYWCFYDSCFDLLKDYEYFSNVSKTDQRYNTSITGRNQTVLIGGSGKTDAGIRETWKWDRYQTSTDPAEILLRDVAGKEARFFYGFDAIILDPAPGITYKRTLHNTNLTVKTFTMDDFNERFDSVFLESLEEDFENKLNLLIRKVLNVTTNDVNILEVVMDSKNYDINLRKVKLALATNDVVVFRDDEGLIDAKLYVFLDNEFKEYNLGIIHGQGKISGSLVAIDFYNSGKKIEVFDYESETGIVPAIDQFIPEE